MAKQAQTSNAEMTGREHLVLYHFPYCPFCITVRHKISRLKLDIEQRDIRRNRSFADELFEGGGRYTVPCLRIAREDGSVQWLYESRDIARYLEHYVTLSGV